MIYEKLAFFERKYSSTFRTVCRILIPYHLQNFRKHFIPKRFKLHILIVHIPLTYTNLNQLENEPFLSFNEILHFLLLSKARISSMSLPFQKFHYLFTNVYLNFDEDAKHLINNKMPLNVKN